MVSMENNIRQKNSLVGISMEAGLSIGISMEAGLSIGISMEAGLSIGISMEAGLSIEIVREIVRDCRDKFGADCHRITSLQLF